MANIVEVLDVAPEDEDEEDGAATDLDSQRKGKCVVLKTTTRQTIFLPIVGLVDADKLKPGDLVGSGLIFRSGTSHVMPSLPHGQGAYIPC